MRNVAQIAAALAALAAASACASKPEAAPAVVETPPAPPERTAPPQPPRGPVPGSVEDFQINAGDRVYFGYDRYDLSPDARSTLERQAAWLQRYPTVRIVVGGHCDERGTREYNLALGARRAAAARDYLISLGVPAGRLETISYGKERPIDFGSNEDAWSRNRNAHSEISSGAVS